MKAFRFKRVRRIAICQAVLLLATIGFAPVAEADTVPYTDYSAVGSVGLCDRSGHPVTHGNVDDRPFVWRAVSSTPANAPYSNPGRKATLYAYQPRRNANPSTWSGDTLTSTSSYTNPRYPMAQATALDFRLRDFLNEFRPQVDGLIQLRIYLSGPGLQPDPSANYPATDIRVTGDTWAVVRGASVPCSKGSAKDSEALTSAQRNGQGSASPNEGSAKSSAGGASTAPGASPSASAADTSGGSAAGTSGESGASPLARDGESAKGSESSSNRGVIVAVVVIVVAGGALAAAFLLARRRRAG